MDARFRSDPRVIQFAAQNVVWATKFRNKGWTSLSASQKKAARAVLGPLPAPAGWVPTRPRATPARASQTREGPGQAGKTATITRCEYLCDVVKTVGSTPTFSSWIINPRDPTTFQQMHIMSTQFNKYRFTDLKIRYTATCSFETSGRVAISFTDDSSDPLPAAKSELYAMREHMETSATVSMTKALPRDNKTRFLRDGNTDDPKLVDFGRLVLATYGGENSGPAVIGELFVEYTVVFSDPNYSTSLTQRGEDMLSIGPAYATALIQKTKTQVTLLAAGKWLVIWYAKTALPTPVLGGDGASGQIHTSGDSRYMIATVTANSPGATISSDTLDFTSELRWFISHL